MPWLLVMMEGPMRHSIVCVMKQSDMYMGTGNQVEELQVTCHPKGATAT